MAASSKQGYMAKIGLDLSGIDKQIKTLQSELTKVDKALSTNADSAILANQKYAILDEQAAKLTQKLVDLVSVSSQVNNALSNNSISTEDYRAFQRELENTAQSLRDVNSQRFPTEEIEESAVASKSFTEALSDNNTILRDWASNISSVATEAITRIVDLMASLAQETIEVGKQFETSMSLVAATMGTDQMSEDYQKLEEAAEHYGATTRYTASEVAEALNYMALAGYDANRSIETLPNLLNLAQAGGLDFARASEMLTNSVAALGIETDKVGLYIDKMAVTARSSGTNVEQLGEALLKVGGTARNMAGGITEIDTILGILADNGIKATEGGTKLRNILLKMAKPTKGTYEMLDKLNMSFYDMEGNMRPLPEIFQEMAEKMHDLTQEEKDNLLAKAFNARDVAAINALLNTSAERYETLTQKINAANGASEQMATTMNDNLQGALYQFKSAREALEIEIYKKLDDSLKDIVNNAADIVRGIKGVFDEEDIGAEFTEAFQKIAEMLQEHMPQIISLAEKFGKEIVPRLGEVTAKVVELTTDKILPKLIDLLTWIIDHNETLEKGIKLVIAAMAFDKVATFTDGIFKLVGQMSALATNAGSAATAITGANGAITAGSAALAGEGGAIAMMNAYALAIEAAVVVALALRAALDEVHEAYERNKAEQSVFSDESDAYLKRYTKLTSTDDDTSASQLEKYLEQDTKRLEELKEKRDDLQVQLRKQENKLNQMSIFDPEYATAKAEKTRLENELNKTQHVVTFLANTLIPKEQMLYDEKLEIQEKEEEATRKTNAMNYAANNYSAQKGQQQALDAEIKNIEHAQSELKRLNKKEEELEKERETAGDLWETEAYASKRLTLENVKREKKEFDKQIKDYEQRKQMEVDNQNAVDAEAFAEYLAYQEDIWDKKYHWDKKNQDDYWKEREKFLKDNYVDSQEWWEAWWETETKLGKMDEKTSKDIDKNLKDAEKEIKDKLTKYKNELELAVASGDMTEWEANEKLGEYLKNNLDQTSDLFKTEYTNYLKQQKKLNDQMNKERDDQYKKDVNDQKAFIKRKFQDLENQAKEEQWSERKLWNEKFKLLKEYKKNGDIYIEVYDEYHQDLIDKQYDIIDKERKEQQKKDEEALKNEKKDIEERNKQRRKLFEEAEKEAEEIVKKYYQNSRDEWTKYAQGGTQTVTDAKGKERLVFTDYNKKIQELKAYQKNLSKLKDMGLSNEQLQEIFSMDLDTRMKYISELVNMGAAGRQKYLTDWKNYQKATASVAATETNMRSEEIKAEVKEKYDDLVKDAQISGEDAAHAWRVGWNTGMKGFNLGGIDLLPDEINAGADKYNDQKAYKDIMSLTTSVLDLHNLLLDKDININIDNQKAVTTSIRNLAKMAMNSGSKAYG